MAELPLCLKRPHIERHEHIAIQRVYHGTASEAQQQKAMEWVIKRLCCIGDVSFLPGANDVTSFMEGRRFVGAILMDLIGEPVTENERPRQEQVEHGRGKRRRPRNR